MTVSRTTQGAWKVEDIDERGYYVQRTYFYYTKREAVRMFRAELRTERKG